MSFFQPYKNDKESRKYSFLFFIFKPNLHNSLCCGGPSKAVKESAVSKFTALPKIFGVFQKIDKRERLL